MSPWLENLVKGVNTSEISVNETRETTPFNYDSRSLVNTVQLIPGDGSKVLHSSRRAKQDTDHKNQHTVLALVFKSLLSLFKEIWYQISSGDRKVGLKIQQHRFGPGYQRAVQPGLAAVSIKAEQG